MMKSTWQQLFGSACVEPLRFKSDSLELGAHELHHLQSMQHIHQIMRDTNDTTIVMDKLGAAIRSIFNADRVCLLVANDSDIQHCVVEMASSSAAYASMQLGEEVVVDDSFRLMFEEVMAKKGVFFSALLPQAYAQRYGIQSQMAVTVENQLDKPCVLAIQQCSHRKTWTQQDGALLQAIAECVADRIDVWQLHETLERRTDQYLQLVENMPDGIIILSNQRIIFTNEVMYHMLGEDHASDCLGKNLDDYIHPNFKTISQTHYDSALKGKRNPIHEIKLMDKNDHVLDVVSSSMAIVYHGKPAVQMIMRDVTRRNQMHQELEESLARNKQLARQLIRVQEQERIIIAQNLHDDSGQLLTAMSINLQSMKQHAKGKKAVVLIADMETIMAQLFTSMRASLETLNPTHIDVLGLSDAIRSEMDVWSERFGIVVSLDISKDVDFPCPETATVIFRVIQEALTNIAKHAQASQVWMKLSLVSDYACYLTLEIRDNGCGFDMQQVSGQGFGLVGMRSRVELVSGMFTMESKVNEGTTIIVDFPVHPSDALFE